MLPRRLVRSLISGCRGPSSEILRGRSRISAIPAGKGYRISLHMAETGVNILADAILRNSPAEDLPRPAARALRNAMTSAGQGAIGIAVNVRGIGDVAMRLDEAVASFEEEFLYFRLHRDRETLGAVGFSRNLVFSIGEARLLGEVRGAEIEMRPETALDRYLLQAFAERYLAELSGRTAGTDLGAAIAGIAIGDPWPAAEAIGLGLPDGRYRILRQSIDIEDGTREGEVVFCLPEMSPEKSGREDIIAGWSERFEQTVLDVAYPLDAVLARQRIAARRLSGAKVGDVIPLAGCTVNSVRLETGDRICLARGRIGQSSGHFAVRLEAPPRPTIRDLDEPSPEPEPIIDASAAADEAAPTSGQPAAQA